MCICFQCGEDVPYVFPDDKCIDCTTSGMDEDNNE